MLSTSSTGAWYNQNSIPSLQNAADVLQLPIDKKVQEYKQSVDSIARDSILNTNILVELQQRIIQNPSTPLRDSIKLKDALGRSFALPYAYFNQWEVCSTISALSYPSTEPQRYLKALSDRYFVQKTYLGHIKCRMATFLYLPLLVRAKRSPKPTGPPTCIPGQV